MKTPLLVVLVLVLSLPALAGCYASHGGGGDRSGPDGGRRDGGGVTPIPGRPDAGEGFVDCGRGGRCAIGEVCCIAPDDGVTCVREGLSCPAEPAGCDADADCSGGLRCVRDRCGRPGRCEPVEDDCPAECPGVCACDGTTYCNRCEAEQADVDVRSEGSCSSDPDRGRCERVCARAKPVCGLELSGCEDTCTDDLSDCSRSARREVEECANLDDCGAVIDCLGSIPCIDTF